MAEQQQQLTTLSNKKSELLKEIKEHENTIWKKQKLKDSINEEVDKLKEQLQKQYNILQEDKLKFVSDFKVEKQTLLDEQKLIQVL